MEKYGVIGTRVIGGKTLKLPFGVLLPPPIDKVLIDDRIEMHETERSERADRKLMMLFDGELGESK